MLCFRSWQRIWASKKILTYRFNRNKRNYVRECMSVADGCRDADGCEVCGREAVVSGRDAAPVLEAAEHPLDSVSLAIEDRGEGWLPATIDLGGNVRGRAGRLDLATDRVAVVALVGEEDAAGWQVLEKARSGRAIGDVAAGEQEGERTTEAIRQRVDLGRAATSRAADRLGRLPPFAPEAERCAFTAELSIRTWAGGPPASARLRKRRSHTPLIVQRMKRL